MIEELNALGAAYEEIRSLKVTIARVQALLDHDPVKNVTVQKLREALKDPML